MIKVRNISKSEIPSPKHQGRRALLLHVTLEDDSDTDVASLKRHAEGLIEVDSGQSYPGQAIVYWSFLGGERTRLYIYEK